MKDDDSIQPYGPDKQSRRPVFAIELLAGSFVAICSRMEESSVAIGGSGWRTVGRSRRR